MPVVRPVDVELTTSDSHAAQQDSLHFVSDDDGVNLDDGAVLVAGVDDCVILDAELRVHAERDAGRSPVNVEVSTQT